MGTSSDQAGTVVIGAGVVGAAVAHALCSRHPSLSPVFILEAHSKPAEGITSRNSGVIHSGLYYPPDSLKAQLCIRGQSLLYQWVKEKGVGFAQTGKAIVATSELEEQELDFIESNARASGAKKLERWNSEQLKDRLPEVRGTSALFSPLTGIVDAPALTLSLLRSAEQWGATLLTETQVIAAEQSPEGFKLQTSRGTLTTERVINAAGLRSDDIARMMGINRYTLTPWRGDYFRWKRKARIPHLVYPVKVRNQPGLGIHLTMDLAGLFRLGPDVELSNSKSDFTPRIDKLEKFRISAEKLFGPIRPDELEYDQCGIRPKLRGPEDLLDSDFVISEDLPGWINLVGIESPGLTAALAIGQWVSERLLK